MVFTKFLGDTYFRMEIELYCYEFQTFLYFSLIYLSTYFFGEKIFFVREIHETEKVISRRVKLAPVCLFSTCSYRFDRCLKEISPSVRIIYKMWKESC